MALATFDKVEGMEIERLTVHEYELGYLKLGVALKLEDKQLEEITKAIERIYGPKAGLDFIPKTASFELRIIDKEEKTKRISGPC